MKRIRLPILLSAFSFAIAPGLRAGASPDIPAVEVRACGEGYQLYRDGEPYPIRGAGAGDHIAELAAAGGNSLRTWGEEQTEALLPEARRHGLTIAAGIWIEHERHGFDYDDEEAVRRQIERHKAVVDRQHKHPEILLWSVGNEVWIDAENPKVWDTIEAVAAHIKEVDPHRPVMTVLPHVSRAEVDAIKERCPSIDILGLNSYGGIGAVFADARRFGWDGPVIVAEWGTMGNWEVPATAWGAEIEPTSTGKGHMMALHYGRIASEPRNLGDYVFYWGQKQETTPTWFNLFLADGNAVAGVDVMHYLWTGEEPVHEAPVLTPIRLNGQRPGDNVTIAPASRNKAVFTLVRPKAEEVRIRWECLPESRHKKVGGDAEPVPEPVPLRNPDSPSPGAFVFDAPATPGPYRLFVYVTTPHGKAATANFPFLVSPAP